MGSSLSLGRDPRSRPEAPRAPPPRTQAPSQAQDAGVSAVVPALQEAELPAHRGSYSATCSLQPLSLSSFSGFFHLLLQKACSRKTAGLTAQGIRREKLCPTVRAGPAGRDGNSPQHDPQGQGTGDGREARLTEAPVTCPFHSGRGSCRRLLSASHPGQHGLAIRMELMPWPFIPG